MTFFYSVCSKLWLLQIFFGLLAENQERSIFLTENLLDFFGKQQQKKTIKKDRMDNTSKSKREDNIRKKLKNVKTVISSQKFMNFSFDL